MDVPGYALITGAASGIGKACVEAFVAEGAAGVALMDISDEDVPGKNTRCHVVAYTIDVTNEEQVNKVISEVAKAFGRLDYVVNAAGVAFKHSDGAAFADTKDWKRVMDVNINGSFFVLRAVAQIMLKQEPIRSSIDGRALQRGFIVNMASILGLVAIPMHTAYTASKHAVVGLTQTASLDYAKDGLRINAMCPGFTETPMTTGQDIRQTIDDAVRHSVPMRRIGQPKEIADGVLFLAGGRSSFITGTTLVVDGGYMSK
ncbi:NAD(P)-binding domain protein [Metarhizium rileyi]|uniref:Hydroxynaphthalene reductase-like protein Arp2 n=1 Tax=Metarhizium rileyi (strain RCEF 4871) TaxID=1649241 RepID=A0A166X942_METRR|nr:NAD(P)-binding domain protein [Metarhizium rileyi RCEF 4871]